MKVGDRIRYSDTFLRAIGQHTGPMCFGLGTVIGLQLLSSVTLAEVEWDKGYDLPKKVNVWNLEVIR